jgi:hypothetical protein
MRTLFPLFLLLAGCPNDDDTDDTDTGDGPGIACFLTTTLTGALEEEIDWDSMDGCRGFGDWQSVTAVFGGPATGFYVVVTTMAVQEQTGTGLDATVRIEHDTLGNWETSDGDCTADLDQNEFVEQSMTTETWRVGGSGSCTGDALGVDGNTGDPVMIGAFEFRSDVAW